MDAISSYAIAYACLEGILVMPLAIIWIISLFTCRRRGDPARRPFRWMKVVYPLLTLAIILSVAQNIIYVVEINDEFSYYDNGSFYTLDEIQSRLFDVSELFENIAHVFLLQCLVDLGLSFLYVWNRDLKGHMIVRSVTATFGGILLILAIALFAKAEAVRTDWYNSVRRFNDPSPDLAGFSTLRKLESAFDITLWVISLPVTAFTIYILVISRKQTQLRRNAVLFFVIGILYLLRNTWLFAYDAKWLLPYNLFTNVPLYTEILDPLLDMWSIFVVLVLIFVIGCRKRDGLWTTQYGGGQPQVQQAWPVAPEPIPQQGSVPTQYYPPGVSMQQQIPSPGWQQPAYYHQQPPQGQLALPTVGTPPPVSPQSPSPIQQVNGQYQQNIYEVDSKP